MENEKQNELKVSSKKELMLKLLVLLNHSLKIEAITENEYLRMKAGIDTVIYEEENPKQKKQQECRTSALSLEKMADASKIVQIDKKDVIVKNYISEEVEMLRQFEIYISKQGKMGVKEFLKFLEAQQKVEKKILSIKI